MCDDLVTHRNIFQKHGSDMNFGNIFFEKNSIDVKNRERFKKAGPEAWKRPQKVERDCYTLFLILSFAFEQQGKSEEMVEFLQN